MAKKFLSIILATNLLLFLFFIIFPGAVFGAGATGDWSSESGGAQTTGDIKLTYPWTGETTFTGLVSKFYNIALGLVGVAALGAIIYGGILWTVSKTPSGSQEAKDWITGAIWGLLLLLGAYILFNTIGIIKKGELVEPGISALPAPAEEELSEIQKAERNAELVDDMKTKDYLRNLSVFFNKNAGCAASFDKGCTSVAKLPENAISGLKKITSKDGCNCAVTVTGGTEKSGHQTHGPNQPIIDLRYKQSGEYGVNTSLLEYLNKQTGVSLLKNQNRDIPTKDGSMTVRSETNSDGSQHFHIVFK